jgi:hypothetical protein
MTHFSALTPWLLALLMLSAAGTACQEEPPQTLSQLAAAALVPDDVRDKAGNPTDVAPPGLPLLTIVAVNPESLVSRVRPVLSLLPEYNSDRMVTTTLRLLQETAGLYLEVEAFELAADNEKREVVLRSMPAMLLAVPGKGISPQRTAAVLTELLAGRWPGTDGGGRLQCEPRETGVFCLTHADRYPDEGRQRNFATRAIYMIHQEQRGIRLTLQVHPLLESLESFVTTPLFWAVVPEEFLTLTTVGARIDLETDRIELSVVGRDSAILRSLEQLLTTAGGQGRLPPGIPLLAYTTISDVSLRASKAQEHWDDKLRVPKAWRIETFIDKSWQRQLMEMASGTVGFALAGPVDIGEVNWKNIMKLDSLVFFMEFADRKALEKRLEHIFTSKYFRLEDELLETGERVTRALRRRGRKRQDEERMTWFFKDGFCYFGSTTKIVRDFTGRIETAVKAGTPLTALELREDEKLRVALSPGQVTQALQLPEKSGMTEKIAFGVFKNSVVELTEAMEVSLVAAADGATTRLSVRVDSFFATYSAFLSKTGPLLKLLPSTDS